MAPTKFRLDTTLFHVQSWNDGETMSCVFFLNTVQRVEMFLKQILEKDFVWGCGSQFGSCSLPGVVVDKITS